MYAFRKPFSVGVYENLFLWGLDYKIILISSQVLGYMLSKFIGIKVVSELKHNKREMTILFLILFSFLSLFLFGITPFPYNFIWMFFNGLPLGMIWGIVFSYIEGKKNTELLGAGMSASFILSSGIVKSIGKYFLEELHFSEFWMPFITAAVFIPLLLLGVFMLKKIPKQDEDDIILRSERAPMNAKERKSFLFEFFPGVIYIVIIYIILTIYREIRDNFSVEIWTAIGYKNTSRILLYSEIPIAIVVFAIISFMIFIKNNKLAFFSNMFMILLGGLFLILSTLLMQFKFISPTLWMVFVGFSMYLSYISFHTMFFERWIALFRCKSNIGFLMYVADSFGYLGSVSVLFYKNFINLKMNWFSFLVSLSYFFGGIIILLSVISWRYFFMKVKEKQYLN
jgi:MFS family permease